MNTSLVMTSIHNPSAAIRMFRDTNIFTHLIVVGDRKTPEGWFEAGVDYLSPARQQEVAPSLSEVLPWNHYSRKMVGYVEAIRRGVHRIYESDDDNCPEPWFATPEEAPYESMTEITPNLGFVNIYRRFSGDQIWPRGTPLDLINEKKDLSGRVTPFVQASIVQGLANGSPDVDAIYRLLEFNEDVTFARQSPAILGAGTWAPLNSQNTWFSREVFPLLYLPSTVTFRFTDILRGIVAQPICWKFGHAIAFTEATVRQDRNPHSPIEDFHDETPMYKHVKQVYEIATAAALESSSLVGSLRKAYEFLEDQKIVGPEEVLRLAAWLDEIGQED